MTVALEAPRPATEARTERDDQRVVPPGLSWDTHITINAAGRATFRRSDRNAGVERDGTFHVGESALIMRGPVDIDLTTQPSPDIAIEFDAIGGTFVSRHRQSDGTFHSADRSLVPPRLTANDVVDQTPPRRRVGPGRLGPRLEGMGPRHAAPSPSGRSMDP